MDDDVGVAWAAHRREEKFKKKKKKKNKRERKRKGSDHSEDPDVDRKTSEWFSWEQDKKV
jgi:hypothetical protein